MIHEEVSRPVETKTQKPGHQSHESSNGPRKHVAIHVRDDVKHDLTRASSHIYETCYTHTHDTRAIRKYRPLCVVSTHGKGGRKNRPRCVTRLRTPFLRNNNQRGVYRPKNMKTEEKSSDQKCHPVVARNFRETSQRLKAWLRPPHVSPLLLPVAPSFFSFSMRSPLFCSPRDTRDLIRPTI